MADTAHGHRPRLEGEYGVDAQTYDLSICFVKLRQRTVERRGLIGSAAGKGERKSVKHYPLPTVLVERNFFAFVAFQLDIRRFCTSFEHDGFSYR